MIYTSGTMAVDENATAVYSKEDADMQTRYILDKISTALQQVGSCMADIVHVNAYTTVRTDVAIVAAEFPRVFRTILPAVTLLVVADLPRADCTVMIQVQAVVQQHTKGEN